MHPTNFSESKTGKMFHLRKLLQCRQWIRLIQYAFLGLFVATFFIFYLVFLPSRTSFTIENLKTCGAKREVFEASRNFSVILWTSYFNLKDHHNFDESQPDDCPYTNCEFTNDREREADAIVFHEADINLLDMPQKRKLNERWVLFNQEAPTNSFVLSPELNGLFNWSMSYSEADDVTVPYFEMCLEDENETGPENSTYSNSEEDEKKWAAVWFVSNCQTPSRRMAYVEELQKYMTVDIIGKCSPTKIHCSKENHKQCLDSFLSKYKFVLAFENSICTDYVTEKLRNILPYDVIPVFWGGVDYGKFLPRESFVLANDYPQPRDLAKTLFRYRDNTIFWKAINRRSRISAERINWKCKLCEKLNKTPLNQTTIRTHLYKDTVKYGRCKTWKRGSFVEHHH